MIEYNSELDPAERLVQPAATGPWSGTGFFGASLGALGEDKGYRLAHCELAGANAFFVRAGKFGAFLDPSQVQRRGPNYFLTSYGHPHDETDREYVRVRAAWTSTAADQARARLPLRPAFTDRVSSSASTSSSPRSMPSSEARTTSSGSFLGASMPAVMSVSV